MRKELVIQKTKSQDREAETIFFTRASKVRIDELCTAIIFASVLLRYAYIIKMVSASRS